MLSRKFFSNKIWEAARVFSECEAWLDLIQSARFEATETNRYIGEREITYRRGQYPASIRFLSKKWQWSERAVRTFLQKLKREKMITIDNLQGMNLITLCKYDQYNGTDTANDTANDTVNDTNTAQEIKRLTNMVTQLTTQLLTQQTTQGRHTGDTKNKKENNTNTTTTGGTNVPPCGTSQPHEAVDYDRLVDFFNSETKGIFGTIRLPLSDTRRGMISARIKEHGKKTFKGMIQKAAASNYLKGQNKNSWRATFDWMIRPNNYEKIITGNYDNQAIQPTPNASSEEFARNIAEGLARAEHNRQRTDP